ncbi:MAG: competence/damage-inducible protein A [Candidatus Sericytochromatia bacterium]
MSEPISALLIAVGTELTSGQVINTNAAWIGEQLTEAGLENLLHWTVPDNGELIYSALASAFGQTRLVILSGGLGPTSDDFTREIVSTWLGKPLVFHAPSWERLEARAARIGFTLGASQKQQCWFPEGATVLTNPVGTADAFACQQDGVTLLVLPGPPSEIKALWVEAPLQQILKPHYPERAPVRLKRWQCLGLGEGTVGEKVEAALSRYQGLVTGYRAHFPYIEVKVWHPADQDTENWVKAIEDSLGEAIVLRDEEDACSRLWASFPPQTPVTLTDFASGGWLASRLQACLHDHAAQAPLHVQLCWDERQFLPQAGMDELAKAHPPEGLQLVLGGLDADGQWGIGLRWRDQLRFERLHTPYAKGGSRDRYQRWLVEKALLTWWEWLHA